jgi:hypothetical protein
VVLVHERAERCGQLVSRLPESVNLHAGERVIAKHRLLDDPDDRKQHPQSNDTSRQMNRADLPEPFDGSQEQHEQTSKHQEGPSSAPRIDGQGTMVERAHERIVEALLARHYGRGVRHVDLAQKGVGGRAELQPRVSRERHELCGRTDADDQEQDDDQANRCRYWSRVPAAPMREASDDCGGREQRGIGPWIHRAKRQRAPCDEQPPADQKCAVDERKGLGGGG